MFGRITFIAALALGSTVASACPTGMTKYAEKNGRTICRFLSNDVLSQEVTLTAEYDYQLIRQPDATGRDSFGTYIGGDNSNASKLTILPGVTIYGDSNTFLSISRGSKIQAEGTATQPIILTTSTGNQSRGQWGGLLINGNAPTNSPADANCSGGVAFEGVKERNVCFGGGNADDSSGLIKYVRVEYGGYPIVPDKEINGFSFNGVGRGTEVDFVQAHMIADDCFEFFGGTVDLRHVICTGSDDDGIDSDLGYNGRIQYAIVHYADDKGDSGFEWANHGKKELYNSTPRANPTISNATVIGGAKSGFGMMLYKGTSATIMNSIFTGFTKACVNVDDQATMDHGGLSVTSTVISCAKNFEEGDAFSVENWFRSLSDNSTAASVALNGYVLDAGSELQNKGVASSDLFFEETSFIGAIGSSSEDWTAGWMKPL